MRRSSPSTTPETVAPDTAGSCTSPASNRFISSARRASATFWLRLPSVFFVAAIVFPGSGVVGVFVEPADAADIVVFDRRVLVDHLRLGRGGDEAHELVH